MCDCPPRPREDRRRTPDAQLQPEELKRVIILGTGEDGSSGGTGTFNEGAMTMGNPPAQIAAYTNNSLVFGLVAARTLAAGRFVPGRQYFWRRPGTHVIMASPRRLLSAAWILCGCSLNLRGLSGTNDAGPADTAAMAGASGGATADAGDGGSGPGGEGGAPAGNAGAGGAAGAPIGGTGGTGATPDDGGVDGADAGMVSVIGCADGTREGYTNLQLHPAIAACSGAWSVPGFVTAGTLTPQCAREAGNDGQLPNGVGCSVADLCAEGWHVCLDALELAGLSETCAPAVAPALNNQVFFATRQHGSADGMCVAATAASSSNNIHGCGNFGTVESAAQSASCAPLVPFRLEQVDCFNIVGWACGTDPNSTTELNDATKPSSAAGGVLCCRD